MQQWRFMQGVPKQQIGPGLVEVIARMLVFANNIHENSGVLTHAATISNTLLADLLAAALTRVLTMLLFNTLFILIARYHAKLLWGYLSFQPFILVMQLYQPQIEVDRALLMGYCTCAYLCKTLVQKMSGNGIQLGCSHRGVDHSRNQCNTLSY